MAESIDPLSFGRNDEFNGIQMLSKDENPVILRRSRKYRMAGSQRDKITMAIMKSDMAALWRDGESYANIAERVSDNYGLEGDERISAHGIQYHIKKMLDYWRQKGLALMDERQAVVLARFDQIESLAVEAYFASMEGKKTVQKNKQIEKARSHDRKKQMLDKEVERRDASRKATKELFIDTGELSDLLVVTQEKIQRNVRNEENQAGDPKFLNIIFSINRERAKILGLYNRRDHDDGDSAAAQLTDEQRQTRIATIISAAKERRSAQANMLADPAPLGGFEDGIARPNVPEIDVEDDWGFDEDTLDVPEVEWD